MTKTAAIAKFAEAYMTYVAPRAACLDKNVALAYAVQDLLNQVKGQKEEWQIELILDEAAYISGRAA
jgi:hypothetical protein